MWLGKLLLTASALLWGFVTVCYWRRPDSCAAVTLWPVWAWVFPGLVLVLAGRRRQRRWAWALLVLWLGYLAAFAEEPRSLARSALSSDKGLRRSGNAVRVISINCAGGSVEAALEVARYHPDIVLLQESPSRQEVERAAGKIFGKNAGVAWGMDASILARGRVDELPVGREAELLMTAARVTLVSGGEVQAVSVRLAPPVAQMDVWLPRCWREQRENRLVHQAQVRQIARELGHLPKNMPLVLGGDLNVPAGDGALIPLRGRLRDTFPGSGRGWGNTVLNDFPVLRFDQIWASQGLRTVSVVARKTRNSDHRMVICDLVLTRQCASRKALSWAREYAWQ